MPRLGRPVVLPRGEKTPLGKLLEDRGISARVLGEAIAIREGRPKRVPTEQVNHWIWGRKQPSSWRRQMICELLKIDPDDLFPVKPRGSAPTAAELQLVEDARDAAVDPTAAFERAAGHLKRASAQDPLPPSDVAVLTTRVSRTSIIEHGRTPAHSLKKAA